MRILMTADTIGGVWTYALELARVLTTHDVEVHLATMGAPLSCAQWEAVSAIPQLTVHESSYKLEWMEDPWDDVEEAARWLLELKNLVCPDLVHLNGYAHGALAWDIPVLVVGHSCVLSWWQNVKGESAPSGWDIYRREIKCGLQAANLVVAPTQAMLDELERYYGPFAGTQVIHNGVRASNYIPQRKAPFILAAGRVWDEAKNIAALEESAPYVAWPIYVAGDSQHPTGGAVQHSHLHLLGQLDAGQLIDCLSRAAIYALPARYEPFGLSILEAGLCGCALVLGDIPSLREVWGEAALYVTPDDPAALQNALTRLIEDVALRSSLGQRARLRAMKFDANRMGRAYLEIYRRMVLQNSGYERLAVAP